MRLKPTNIELMRGDDEVRLVRLKRRTKTGELLPFDLCRYQRFSLHARDTDSEELVVQLESDNQAITLQSAVEGELLLHFAHATTENAEWGTADYDLQAVDEDGKIKTLLRGTIRLTHDITRRR